MPTEAVSGARTYSSGMTHPNAASRPVQAVVLAGRQAPTASLHRRPAQADGRDPGTGTPIIGHQLTWLAEEGVTDVVVSCGHLAEVLPKWLDSADLPVNITTVVNRNRSAGAAA